MIRNLSYGIPIREGADSIGLTRYLELEEGCDVNEEFLIATPHHSIGFIPTELDLLHAAIHEMERMHDQHVDALTDGAGAEVKSEPEPAEEESADQAALCDAERDILGHLVDGGTLYCENARGTFYIEREDAAYVHRDYISTLLDNRLIEPINPPSLSVGKTYYAITDKGRANLAEADDG